MTSSNGIRRRPLLLAGASLFAPPLTLRAQARQPGETLIGGTGVGLGVLSTVLEGTPKLRFVPNLGTGGGLKALAAGAIDIALSARAPSEAERTAGLVGRELFRTPIVLAVHGDVPVRNATVIELAALYAGRTVQWPHGVPVRTVLRPESDSDSKFVDAFGPAMAEAHAVARTRPGTHVAITDADATEALQRIAGSIGVTSLGLVRAEGRRLHALALDGVMPGLDTLASRRYPHAKMVHAVTRGEPSAEAQKVIAALVSRAGVQRLADLACLAAPAA